MHRHRDSVITFPSDLEILTTREFDAPLTLVWDVLTRPEHIRHWFAPFEDTVTVCEMDVRVGGDYHIVFVTPKGEECSFRGTYSEVDAPHRSVATWQFEGWPGVVAVETVTLSETDGVTTVVMALAFEDLEGRRHMGHNDGQESSWDKLEAYLHSVVSAVGSAGESGGQPVGRGD